MRYCIFAAGDMSTFPSDDGKVGVEIRAPTYVELHALVEELRAKLDANSAERTLAQATVVGDCPPRANQPLEHRVIGDLSKGADKFRGRETPVEAEDWLLGIKGLTTVNKWQFQYTLQYLRMQLEAAAKDWFVGRTFRDWDEFEQKFRKTFVRTSCASDRLDLMRARKQGRSEALMDYFQPKVRMCRELAMSFEVTKDYVLRGLFMRNLALYAVGRKHADDDDLLDDLLGWERMNSLHQAASNSEPPVEKSKPRTTTKPVVVPVAY